MSHIVKLTFVSSFSCRINPRELILNFLNVLKSSELFFGQKYVKFRFNKTYERFVNYSFSTYFMLYTLKTCLHSQTSYILGKNSNAYVEIQMKFLVILLPKFYFIKKLFLVKLKYFRFTISIFAYVLCIHSCRC